jgi:hypothetical protein
VDNKSIVGVAICAIPGYRMEATDTRMKFDNPNRLTRNMKVKADRIPFCAISRSSPKFAFLKDIQALSRPLKLIKNTTPNTI